MRQNRDVKHKARGPKSVSQRFQTGPLSSFGNCEGACKLLVLNCIFKVFAASPTDKDFTLMASPWPFIQHQSKKAVVCVFFPSLRFLKSSVEI